MIRGIGIPSRSCAVLAAHAPSRSRNACLPPLRQLATSQTPTKASGAIPRGRCSTDSYKSRPRLAKPPGFRCLFDLPDHGAEHAACRSARLPPCRHPGTSGRAWTDSAFRHRSRRHLFLNSGQSRRDSNPDSNPDGIQPSNNEPSRTSLAGARSARAGRPPRAGQRPRTPGCRPPARPSRSSSPACTASAARPSGPREKSRGQRPRWQPWDIDSTHELDD
jgi:hypothetical protein